MATNYQRITDLSTAGGVGLTVPTNCWSALIQAEGGTVRVRNDEVAPTSTTGVLLTDGDVITLTERLDDVLMWSTDGTANVNIIYGKNSMPPVLVIA